MSLLFAILFIPVFVYWAWLLVAAWLCTQRRTRVVSEIETDTGDLVSDTSPTCD